MWLGGNDIDEPLGNRRLQINSYPLVIEAARKNQGVALGWRHLVDDLVRRGDLVRPVRQSLVTEFGYYLLCREIAPSDDRVDQLGDRACDAGDRADLDVRGVRGSAGRHHCRRDESSFRSCIHWIPPMFFPFSRTLPARLIASRAVRAQPTPEPRVTAPI